MAGWSLYILFYIHYNFGLNYFLPSQVLKHYLVSYICWACVHQFGATYVGNVCWMFLAELRRHILNVITPWIRVTDPHNHAGYLLLSVTHKYSHMMENILCLLHLCWMYINTNVGYRAYSSCRRERHGPSWGNHLELL